MSPLETALAVPLPDGRCSPARSTEFDGDPRAALDAVVADAYARGPAGAAPYVLFSGGRDSSAVLAVAVAWARRHDAPLPVPVTARHRDDPAADETAWQELVLHHLGLTDPVVLTFRDEQRLLGVRSRATLQRFGALWPAAVTLHPAIYRHLEPGRVLLTGEGGDHVLLPQRITALRNGLRHRRPRRTAVGLLQWLLGGRVDLSALPPWLTPAARRLALPALAAASRAPLRFDDAIRAMFDNEVDATVLRNFDAMAAQFGLRPVHPFVDGRFRTAWARAGGAWGFAGRNDNMKRLFADLLPAALLVRETKADFNASRWGEGERTYAQEWSGAGVDPALVQVERLRQEWLAPHPHPFAEFLLQHCWLAEGGS